MTKKERILLTGSNGFLGNKILLKLIEEGYCVNAFDLKEPSSKSKVKTDSVKYFTGSILEKKDIENAIKGCDFVIHTAGYHSYFLIDSKKLYDINFTGTKNMLEVSKENNIKKFIHIGSTASLGLSKTSKLLNENSDFDNSYEKIDYIRTKKLAYDECMKFSKEGLNVVVMSPCKIVGNSDYNVSMFKEVIKGIVDAPIGGTSLIDVDDAVNGILLGLEKGKTGERYILTGGDFSRHELINLIAEITGSKHVDYTSKKGKLFLMTQLLKEKQLMMSGKKPNKPYNSYIIEDSFRYFDNTKARKELGFVAKNKVKTTLENAYEYYKKEGLL